MEGGGGLISAILLARPVTRSSLGRNSCWPHSRVLVECLFLLLPPFLCVAWSCTVVDKNDHTIGAIQSLTFFYGVVEPTSDRLAERSDVVEFFKKYCAIGPG